MTRETSKSAKNSCNLDFESVRQQLERLQGYALLAGFDTVKMPAIEAGHFGELNLRDPLLLSQLRDAVADLYFNVAVQSIRLWTGINQSCAVFKQQ